MTKIVVASLRSYKVQLGNGDVTHRCDRVSLLGNPIELDLEVNRDLVCDSYDTYFNDVVRFQIDPALSVTQLLSENSKLTKADRWKAPLIHEFMAELDQLVAKLNKVKPDGRLVLLCWCSPRRCHCDKIKNYLIK